MKISLLTIGLVFIMTISGCGAGTIKNNNANAGNAKNDSGLTPEEQAAIDQALINEGFEFDETGEQNSGGSDTLVEEEKDPRENMSEEEIKQAEERDRTRLSHIENLQKALESFYKDKQSYPEKIEELVDTYIKELPKDPSTNELYSYTPIGALPANYYDLLYTLEVGVDDKPFGVNVASPELKQ